MIRYAKPKTLDEALSLMAEGAWRVLSGATDIYPAQGAKPFRQDMLDIAAIPCLAGVRQEGGGWRIGARTTWTAVAAADVPPAFDALRQAAREVGSVQIQNVATIGGNLCNASPAADGVPPLLALDASVELASQAGLRMISLAEFLKGNRRTELRPDEIMTAIVVPNEAAVGRSAFLKLGARRYLVISIAMAAVNLTTDASGAISTAAVAVGSCAATGVRLPSVERLLAGRRTVETVTAALRDCALPEIRPIDDVRGSADYRRDAVRTLIARAVARLLDAGGEEVRAA